MLFRFLGLCNGSKFLIELLLLLGGGWQCSLFPLISMINSCADICWVSRVDANAVFAESVPCTVPRAQLGTGELKGQMCRPQLQFWKRSCASSRGPVTFVGLEIYEVDRLLKTKVTIVFSQLQGVLRCDIFRVPSLLQVQHREGVRRLKYGGRLRLWKPWAFTHFLQNHKQNPICRPWVPIESLIMGARYACWLGHEARGWGLTDWLIFPGLSLSSLSSFKIQKIMQNA